VRWLLHYPLQRTEDIAFGVRAIERTIRRHLLVLSDAGLVEQVLFARLGVLLTDQGVRAAAADEGLDPEGRLISGRHRSIVCYSCFLACQSLLAAQNWINDLIEGAPTHLAFQGRKPYPLVLEARVYPHLSVDQTSLHSLYRRCCSSPPTIGPS